MGESECLKLANQKSQKEARSRKLVRFKHETENETEDRKERQKRKYAAFRQKLDEDWQRKQKRKKTECTTDQVVDKISLLAKQKRRLSDGSRERWNSMLKAK